jgi:hypothetical protein
MGRRASRVQLARVAQVAHRAHGAGRGAQRAEPTLRIEHATNFAQKIIVLSLRIVDDLEGNARWHRSRLSAMCGRSIKRTFSAAAILKAIV